MTALVLPVAPVVAAELTNDELRTALETLDRRELETLIQQIYAAAGGLH